MEGQSYAPAAFIPRKHSCYLTSIWGWVSHSANDTIGNRTRELTACRAVPQPTAPPGTANARYCQIYTCIRHTFIQILLRWLWDGKLTSVSSRQGQQLADITRLNTSPPCASTTSPTKFVSSGVHLVSQRHVERGKRHPYLHVCHPLQAKKKWTDTPFVCVYVGGGAGGIPPVYRSVFIQ
jgi:hypothetical protein